jgi:hypothetical protein
LWLISKFTNNFYNLGSWSVSSLSADAPGGEETDEDQWDKSGETPERNVLRNFHAAVLGKS